MSDEFEWDDVDFSSIEDPTADAIGSLVVNFAYFNSCLDGAASSFMSLNIEQARALIVPLQPREKVKIIRGFANAHLNDERKDKVKSVCKRCDELISYRNAVLHSHMVRRSQKGPVELYDYSGSGRFNPKSRELPADEVAHNAVHALVLGKEVHELGIENEKLKTK